MYPPPPSGLQPRETGFLGQVCEERALWGEGDSYLELAKMMKSLVIGDTYLRWGESWNSNVRAVLSCRNSLFLPTLFPETCSSWRISTKNDRLALWLWFHFVYDVMWSLLSVAPQFSVILVNLKLHWAPVRWQLPSHCCCHALGGPCHARCHGVTHSVTRVTWPHHPPEHLPKVLPLQSLKPVKNIKVSCQESGWPPQSFHRFLYTWTHCNHIFWCQEFQWLPVVDGQWPWGDKREREGMSN